MSTDAVRKIIGDPFNKLMQDEVADRISGLVKVLQNIIGLADAITLIGKNQENPRYRKLCQECSRKITEVVADAMPEWEEVLKAVYEAKRGRGA